MTNDKKTSNGADTGGLPLFYTNPMPLDAVRHATLGLKSDIGLGFAAKVNAVPVNLVEFPQACHFYPIAFSPDESGTPVALLGLRDNENLFVSKDGSWADEAYVPAYVRRYPFIFSETTEHDRLSLCIDMNADFVSEASDQKFFDAGGKPSVLSQNALEFCKSYHAAAAATIAFGEAIAASGILVVRQVEIVTEAGGKVNFSGFRIIDEEKFAALPDATFLDWRRKGWLPFLYAHLFSSAQWQRLTRLLNKRMENTKQ